MLSNRTMTRFANDDHPNRPSSGQAPNGIRWRSIAVTAAVTLAVVLVIRSVAIQVFHVPSESMCPTLVPGDIQIISKWPYGWSTASLPFGAPPPGMNRLMGRVPNRGDVVVFRWPGNPSQTWVKRVVGLPGDVVAIHGGLATVDGWDPMASPPSTGAPGNMPAPADSCLGPGTTLKVERLPGAPDHTVALDDDQPRNRDEPAVAVPAGMLYVMGDNRDHSADSRVPLREGGAGFVPIADLEGRSEFIIVNRDDIARRFTRIGK